MTNTNAHKPGYKHTPLGWIPNDWKINSIGKAFEICNNMRYPISEEVRKKMKGEYPYYGPTKIQDYINEYRVDGKFALIGEDGDHFLKWKEQPMTLLISGKFNVNNHAHLIKGKGENLTEWFYYYFYHKELTTHLTRQGAGRYKLTKDALSKIPIVLPSLREQQKISTILNKWDEDIQKTQQIIEKVKLRSKGLMHQLLSGRKRLNGFNKKWKNYQLGDFIKESRISSQGNSVNKRITVKLNLKGIEKREARGNEIEKATAYFKRKAGQFIYGKQNLHKGAFGIIPIELDGFESSQDIPAFDFTEIINPQYFLSFLSQEHIYQGLERISTGTGSKRIHPEELYKIAHAFPGLDEQTSIVKILQSSDNELYLYRQLLFLLQQQKKGLMQKLLSGEVRVNVN